LKVSSEKVALVIGSTGQDGAYLSRHLLELGYRVVATRRRTSMLNTQRLDWILRDLEAEKAKNLLIEYADVTDALSITYLLDKYLPDEVYNLSAQSHVGVSFEQPEYTANVNALGPLRILEAIRILGNKKRIKFYQASTSELFGDVLNWPQSELTPFNVVSPYAAAKQFAHCLVKIYREAYGMFACSGILFNHESPLRGSNFVTKKVVRGLCEFQRSATKLHLGNLDAIRDWGHARDYVQMQHLMLQQKKPKDFVIGSGKETTVREFVEKVAHRIQLQIEWQGSRINEVGVCIKANNRDLVGETIVKVDPKYFRPLEVEKLLADPTLAKSELNWLPQSNLTEMINEMVEFELVKPNFDVI
jgi:GDPmannose 4,6-dehydratase